MFDLFQMLSKHFYLGGWFLTMTTAMYTCFWKCQAAEVPVPQHNCVVNSRVFTSLGKSWGSCLLRWVGTEWHAHTRQPWKRTLSEDCAIVRMNSTLSLVLTFSTVRRFAIRSWVLANEMILKAIEMILDTPLMRGAQTVLNISKHPTIRKVTVFDCK